jgi:hypothetical protein
MSQVEEVLGALQVFIPPGDATPTPIGKTPWEIIEAERPGISPRTLLLPPIIIDDLFDHVHNATYRLVRVGHLVPVAPGASSVRPLTLWDITPIIHRSRSVRHTQGFHLDAGTSKEGRPA